MTRLQRLKKDYSTLHYFWKKLYNKSWCSLALTEDDDSRKTRRIIEEHLLDIKRLMEGAFDKKIGGEVLNEIRRGKEK